MEGLSNLRVLVKMGQIFRWDTDVETSMLESLESIGGSEREVRMQRLEVEVVYAPADYNVSDRMYAQRWVRGLGDGEEPWRVEMQCHYI